MGTISDKLTYLNTTKGLIKDTINLTGANITNDTFRSYAHKLKLGLINALNDNGDTIYSNLEKVSGIGSNLSLTPTYKAPIKLNEIQGNTLQNGTPTPSSPVPIQSVTGLQNVGVCGKNLINGLLDNSTTGKKLERTINADENFYLYIKTNNTTSDRCYAFLDSTNVGTIWVSNNNGTLTFSGSRNFAFNRIRIQDNTTVSENMLTLGSTATTYEPYTGNTYEVNLGKNLFDIDTTTSISGGTKTNNVITSSSYSSGTWKGMDVNFSSIPINKEFTISMDLRLTSGSTGTFSKFNDGVNNFTEISKPTISQNWQRYSYKYTPSSGYSISKIFIQMSAIDGQFECKNIQIEVGSQATSYSPYFTPIELNKIGTYEDSIKKSTGKNLLDTSDFYNGYVDSSGNIQSTGVQALFNYIRVNPGETYTISSQGTVNSLNIAQYDINKNFISRTVQSSNPRTFTLGNTTYYIRIWTKVSDSTPMTQEVIDGLNIMLEQNNQATSYEPYGKVWYVEKNIGKINLSNITVSGWWASGTHTIKNSFTNLGITNIKNYSSGSINYGAYSNYFVQKNPSSLYQGTQSIGFGIDESAIYLSNNDWSLETCKNFITNNNIIINYLLGTPIYEVITNTELINQLESLYNAKSKDGTTNINVTSEDLSMILNVGVIKGDA